MNEISLRYEKISKNLIDVTSERDGLKDEVSLLQK